MTLYGQKVEAIPAWCFEILKRFEEHDTAFFAHAQEVNASAHTLETHGHMNHEIFDPVCSFCARCAVSFTERRAVM